MIVISRPVCYMAMKCRKSILGIIDKGIIDKGIIDKGIIDKL